MMIEAPSLKLILLLYASHYWPVTLGLAALFAVLAWKRRGIPRVLLGAASVAAVALCAGLPLYFGLEEASNRASAARQDREYAPFPAARTVDGLDLPAGTRVRYHHFGAHHLSQVDLPGPTPLLGAVLSGHLDFDTLDHWAGALPFAQTIEGVPCAAGLVVLSTGAFHLVQCDTSAPYRVPLFIVPKGTTVWHEPGDGSRSYRLPAGPDIVLRDYQTRLPAFTELTLYSDGSPQSASNQRSEPLIVSGIPLNLSLLWVYGNTPTDGKTPLPLTPQQPLRTLHGELAAAITCGGQRLPAGARVAISPGAKTVIVLQTDAGTSLTLPLPCHRLPAAPQ